MRSVLGPSPSPVRLRSWANAVGGEIWLLGNVAHGPGELLSTRGRENNGGNTK